ncbi:hypothetical protein M422DRAFT_40052 [Sphaerobolus stellatus SS14]|uniref:Uncharacterized protein n=1 Tax=Sphaerobolus stellatus (strain SS14) TaxID=990650 RepID=A0A0C9TKW1_SPHS4|nr:hypothetical protein M422DRAFT_40053 [Sphaerobolus stellatus SS14]KIJ22481.1 hypothetical protein M422DRAFT_40052 [Sphaerobolus stellatus SS14]
MYSRRCHHPSTPFFYHGEEHEYEGSTRIRCHLPRYHDLVAQVLSTWRNPPSTSRRRFLPLRPQISPRSSYLFIQHSSAVRHMILACRRFPHTRYNGTSNVLLPMTTYHPTLLSRTTHSHDPSLIP